MHSLYDQEVKDHNGNRPVGYCIIICMDGRQVQYMALKGFSFQWSSIALIPKNFFRELFVIPVVRMVMAVDNTARLCHCWITIR